MNFVMVFSAVMHILTAGLESKLWTRSSDKAKNTNKNDGCTCLNGGTCQRNHFYTTLSQCACPSGYSGDRCEIDTGATCYREQGLDYRGTVSKTSHGRDCLSWNSALLSEPSYSTQSSDALKLGLGKHNYCRNPDGQSKPWCYYQSFRRISTASCDIPVCESEATGSACGQRTHKLYKIVGGRSSPIESQPWVATIFKNSRKKGDIFFQCGGSLIGSCWVLTAAHCFPEGIRPEDFTVILGRSNYNEANPEKEQEFQVDHIFLHEKFNSETQALKNDIALVKLRESGSGRCAVPTDYVQTVCLPPAAPAPKDGTQCEIAGYGREDYNDYEYSTALKSVKVQLIPQRLCQSTLYYGSLINDNMFCAGDPMWKVDACKGDSGGPLTCQQNDQMELHGIISWGENCAKQHKPGVYTRVSHYLPWIRERMFQSRNIRK